MTSTSRLCPIHRYGALLLRRELREHLALAADYTRPRDAELTPEQLETLRSLGYL